MAHGGWILGASHGGWLLSDGLSSTVIAGLIAVRPLPLPCTAPSVLRSQPPPPAPVPPSCLTRPAAAGVLGDVLRAQLRRHDVQPQPLHQHGEVHVPREGHEVQGRAGAGGHGGDRRVGRARRGPHHHLHPPRRVHLEPDLQPRCERALRPSTVCAAAIDGACWQRGSRTSCCSRWACSTR
eukprot:COSAG04_NODE_6229_length_1376_cov_0.835027_2_plen_181_part_00